VLLLLIRPSDDLVSYWPGMATDERVEIIFIHIQTAVPILRGLGVITQGGGREDTRLGLIDIKFNDEEEAMQPLNHHEP